MPSRPSRPSGTRLLQRLACVVLLVIGIVALQPTGTLAQAVPGQPAVNTVQQQTLRAGWYRWDPYQHLESSEDRTELTGLDVQLLREVFENKLGLRYQLGEVSWQQHQQDLRAGTRDVAGGAFRTRERETYAHYSKPYRYEEVVLYRRRFDPKATLALKDRSALEQDLQQGNCIVGLVKGYYYGDQIEHFATNPANARRIVWSNDHEANLRNLQTGQVDIVPVDRLVGATSAWKNNWTDKLVMSHFTIFRGPIYAIFSRKTTDTTLVKRFDAAMDALRREGRYTTIVQRYLFPVLLALTVGQDWFYALEILGTVAFALSGLLMAHREDFSLFGAFVLAALPAVGGGLMRDIIINRDIPSVLRSPISLMVVITLVLLSFLLIRVLPPMGRIPKWMHLAVVIDLLDAVALAAYTVVGVIVAVETRCDPLILWGPLLSALTGAGGAILRDLVRGDPQHPTLRYSIYAEIALIWGFLLSLYISSYASAATYYPWRLEVAVLITLVGALLTRLLVMATGIRPPRFR
ncbi:MAG: transporter substrate-binding domain-containing protein [Cyanobacteria bacterium K_DeepCast_35m_m2_023]|nr:transporter substrate-binding domain-containing protein [Cyanobacteria bacterium K_DeepCast_35m_m2_023]